MRNANVTVAAIQCPSRGTRGENIARVETHVREAAAARGANVILPPELFEGPYFCREEKAEWFAEARTDRGRRGRRALPAGRARARRRRPGLVLRAAGQAYYNSVAVIDADGAVLGVYRKSHIPDGPGYEEKFYFRPGDTGFRVVATRYGTIGVGICWDQWFPESARAMMLLGAEVLFYPTAIGSEPHDPDLDTRDPWQRAMVGHAVSNVVPVVAANRIGDECGQVFYGSSFIADARGDKRDRARSHGRGRHRRDLRPRRDRRAPRVLGLLPRPPARALRRADARPTAGIASGALAATLGEAERDWNVD